MGITCLRAARRKNFRRQGVESPRQTMCDWMRAGAELVSPLYALIKQQALDSESGSDRRHTGTLRAGPGLAAHPDGPEV